MMVEIPSCASFLGRRMTLGIPSGASLARHHLARAAFFARSRAAAVPRIEELGRGRLAISRIRSAIRCRSTSELHNGHLIETCFYVAKTAFPHDPPEAITFKKTDFFKVLESCKVRRIRGSGGSSTAWSARLFLRFKSQTNNSVLFYLVPDRTGYRVEFYNDRSRVDRYHEKGD
jgi:hypothetical protein